MIVDKSNYINPIEGQLFRVTFLLAAGKILCTKYSIKEWAVLMLFGILGIVSYKATGRNEILRIVAFIAACKGTDVKKLLKYVFYTTAARYRFCQYETFSFPFLFPRSSPLQLLPYLSWYGNYAVLVIIQSCHHVRPLIGVFRQRHMH